MYQKIRGRGLFAGREAFAAEEFLLEAGEEGLGQRIVAGVADRAHREVDPGLLRVGAVDEARVLTDLNRSSSVWEPRSD
jgi:hypothetical protein